MDPYGSQLTFCNLVLHTDELSYRPGDPRQRSGKEDTRIDCLWDHKTVHIYPLQSLKDRDRPPPLS